MAKNKTKPTEADVDAFLAAVEPETKRRDAEAICAMMGSAAGEPPVLWGPSMVGFGRYRYRYPSGREGESFRVGFSPRKANLVVYIVDGIEHYASLTARLGKFKTGKSCLYINTLADVDRTVLETLITASVKSMAAKYPGDE